MKNGVQALLCYRLITKRPRVLIFPRASGMVYVPRKAGMLAGQNRRNVTLVLHCVSDSCIDQNYLLLCEWTMSN